METLDQRTLLRSLYSVGVKEPVFVDVPDLTVIGIEGVGDPNTSAAYQGSVEALMSMAWGLRAYLKASNPPLQIKVMPLEGVWTLPGIPFSEDPAVRAQLQWSLQIVQPDTVTGTQLDEVRAIVRKKKPRLAYLDGVRVEQVPGGPAATTLHIGPYTGEPATLARIHRAIEDAGGEPIWGHREIYLSDPRRTAPEKLKTILRVGIRH